MNTKILRLKQITFLLIVYFFFIKNRSSKVSPGNSGRLSVRLLTNQAMTTSITIFQTTLSTTKILALNLGLSAELLLEDLGTKEFNFS